jgi:hypothetical protein
MSENEISIPELMSAAHMTRGTVLRVLTDNAIEPLRTFDRKGLGALRFYPRDVALPLMMANVTGKVARPAMGMNANIDPKTGLTWAQLETKEKYLKLERERKLADRQDSHEWMQVSDALDIVKRYTDQIERVPEKVQSQAGLTSDQTRILTRLLDEARESAKTEIMKGTK